MYCGYIYENIDEMRTHEKLRHSIELRHVENKKEEVVKFHSFENGQPRK